MNQYASYIVSEIFEISLAGKSELTRCKSRAKRLICQSGKISLAAVKRSQKEVKAFKAVLVGRDEKGRARGFQK